MRDLLTRIGRAFIWPFRFAFLKIAEPRVVRIIQFAVYVLMAAAGGYVFMHPPTSFVHILGDLLVQVFSGFLLLGGLLGALAVLPGVWWLERMGVVALWTGLTMFAVLAAALGVSPVGFCVAVAFCGSLILRWFEIRKYDLAPRVR